MGELLVLGRQYGAIQKIGDEGYIYRNVPIGNGAESAMGWLKSHPTVASEIRKEALFDALRWP